MCAQRFPLNHLLAAGVAGFAPWALATPIEPVPVAVVFDSRDALSEHEVAQILEGIRAHGGIAVTRFPLDGGNPYTLAANLAAGVKVAAAGDAAIAVIYPEMDEPYRSIFTQIVAGIEKGSPNRVMSIAVPSNRSPRDIAAELRDKDIRVVIALGRHGLQAVSELPNTVPVVGGAVLASPEDGATATTLISLTPDPLLLLQRLKRLAPTVRRVFTVYSARQNSWLIGLAREAAKDQGIELVAEEVDDLRGAMRAFTDIVGKADPRRDAIWLPQDAAVLDDEVVLPFVLQQSWDRSLIVFSSTLAHVKRGALFALYPDNQKMGRKLAASALDLADASRPARSVQPLRDVLAALNVRTAGHLGLDLDAAQKDVALVFPAR